MNSFKIVVLVLQTLQTIIYTLQKSYTFNKSLIALVRLDSLNFGVGFHVEKGFFLKLREKL